jgi:hypothetical protein
VRAFRRHLAEHAHLDGAGIEVLHAVLRGSGWARRKASAQ